MGSCIPISDTSSSSCSSKSVSKKQKVDLPIDTLFNFPSPLPNWPPGNGFANGTMDLGGGLTIKEITTFNKVWATYEGGPQNAGATIFEPIELPDGFCLLGFYAQPNNRPLYGRVLVAQDNEKNKLNPTLTQPDDYVLVWTSKSLGLKEDSNAYFWVPISRDGYEPLGLIVTTTPDKPALDKVRCVRSDLTARCELDEWIWGHDQNVKSSGLNIFESRPKERWKEASSVSVGTFMAQNGDGTSNNMPLISCLNNVNKNFSNMPNLQQIDAIIQTYAPRIYNHPKEKFLPSSVNWFYTNGALLYKKGEESNPTQINPTGSNLPQGGSDDGLYWIDLSTDKKAKDILMKGDITSATTYLHIKPMLGATQTDLVIWMFYPYNGPASAKIGIFNIPLGKIGEHVGDWEHITLRVSNFDGMLRKVFFSQHSGGEWVHAPNLEFQNGGGNKFVGYSSLHGHASYPKQGLVLQGNDYIGIRNDSDKSDNFMDIQKNFTIVSANYLGVILEPPWLNYARKWGPKITYNIDDEIHEVIKFLPGKLKADFLNLVKSLPPEILGEDGPTGPKMKTNWNGDEIK